MKLSNVAYQCATPEGRGYYYTVTYFEFLQSSRLPILEVVKEMC